MYRHTRQVAFAVVLSLLGCGPTTSLTKESLLEADRAFAQATQERRGEGWTSFFAESGAMFPETGVLRGRDEIRALMVPALADTNRLLTWEPTDVDMAGSGDLGYTTGRWALQVRDTLGAWTAVETGNYVTLWRYQPDGTWKVIYDIGNTDTIPSPGMLGGS